LKSEHTIRGVKIVNLLGKLVEVTIDKKEIDISDLSSGLYFIEVVTNEGKSVQKFIKD
jgi:hypothetical protein